VQTACRTERVVVTLSQADFNCLVDEHGPTLYRMAYRMIGDAHEAEDMVQEAFRSVWKSRSRYEPGRGDRAWLASILRRRIIDRWRKRPPPAPLADDSPLEIEVAGEDPFAGEFTDEVQAALNRLPEELRETLLLVVVGGLTHQEVADLLEIPLGTVLSRVSRARTRLRDYLLTHAGM
jgi:RNA polymerase sigma-70 factor, ECF subfamily